MQTATVFVTKCKLSKEGEVEIEFTRERSEIGDGAVDEFTLRSKDQPHPDFNKALGDLTTVALELVELPVEYADGVRVSGASFTDNDKQGFGGSITAVKTLRHGVLVINCPHHYKGTKQMQGGPGCFTDEQVSALYQLQIEAVAYVNGKRAQGDMFDHARAAAGDSPEEVDYTSNVIPMRDGKPIAEKAPKEKAKRPGKVKKVKLAKAGKGRKGQPAEDDEDESAAA